MSFRILGTGMYVPPKAVTNDDLAQIVETNDEWITKRVGVKERRISENEWTSEMGAKAAQAALADAGVKVEELDMILAASVSGETVSPSMATMIQHRIGATCPAMEINAACAAFLYLLETAAAFFALRVMSLSSCAEATCPVEKSRATPSSMAGIALQTVLRIEL